MRTDKEIAADILEEAVLLMNDSGRHWIKGILSGKNKKGEQSFCAVGAIQEVSRRKDISLIDGPVLVAENALADTIGRNSYQSGAARIMSYNDHNSTTWKGLKDKFERTIRRLRNAK